MRKLKPWAGLLLLWICILSNIAHASVRRPKLVLLLVIDQFRADYLMRFESRFLPPTRKDGSVGGFNYLMSHGAYYPYGQYDILQSMTCPGHATISTGAFPYQMGIPINTWYDRDTREPRYCVEDHSQRATGRSAHGNFPEKPAWQHGGRRAQDSGIIPRG